MNVEMAIAAAKMINRIAVRRVENNKLATFFMWRNCFIRSCKLTKFSIKIFQKLQFEDLKIEISIRSQKMFKFASHLLPLHVTRITFKP